MIPVWIFVVSIAGTVVILGIPLTGITLLHFRNPLPFPIPDRGHRTFGVKDRKTRDVVTNVLEKVGGLRPKIRFVAGETHQLVFDDDCTVLMYFDEGSKFSGCGLSRPVKDPMGAANAAAAILQEGDYTTNIQELIGEGLESNSVVVLESDAFDHWVLVFRLTGRDMPEMIRE